MDKKKLVILTTHFGLNYSGGSGATCEIFGRLQDHFSKIIVVCQQAGHHCFKNAEIKRYKDQTHALRIISSLNEPGVVFYGDFYNAYWYALLRVPFFFTYHDNWPELAATSYVNKVRSWYYIPIYKWIFRKADKVFSVSQFKMDFIKKQNKNVYLIRNGFNAKNSRKGTKTGDILMVGNIDSRKYALAIKLFGLIESQHATINIYGNVTDSKIAKRLKEFPFVKLHGFAENVPYQNYGLLLHTSFMENLSMVLCEALAHGLPVIAFDVGGAREIIKSHKNGILIPPYDLNAMKTALVEIMNGKLHLNNPPGSLKEFSWEYASEQYKKLMSAQ